MPQQGYIGRNPGDGRTIVNRQTTNVNIGIQTSFTMTVGYEIGYLDVYLNGSKQVETLDYTASDGSTIDFSISSPPVQGDVLEFVAFETLNISNIKSARRNFSVGQDLSVDGKVTIGSSLTIASDLVVNGTFTTINTEILDVEDKTIGIASTSSPSNTTADGAGIVIYGGTDGDKSLTWNTEKSNFVLVGGGVSIGTGVTISTPAANVLAFSVNSAEKARFNNFGAFTVGYEGEAWKESTYVGVLQAGSGAWIGQTPAAGARAEWVNNAYYDSVNTRWEYIAADEANRMYFENGEMHLQSAAAGSADGAITWGERAMMTVGGDFRIGPNAGIGITLSSSGNIDAIGIITATSFTGSGANLTALNASAIASGTVPTARLGSGTASSSTFLRGDSTFQTVNTDLVSDTSPQLGGNLDVNTKNILFGDSSNGSSDDVLAFGAGTDLKIYHAGNENFIRGNATASPLYIDCCENVHIRHLDTDGSNSETMIKAVGDGAVELYHNNTKRFETTAGGTIITGSLDTTDTITGGGHIKTGTDTGKFFAGASNDLQLYHDGTNARLVNNTGLFLLQGTDIRFANADATETILKGVANGAVELYHNDSKKFETHSNGCIFTGSLYGLDNNKIELGNSNDLKIYHDGSHSRIDNQTGALFIRNNTGTYNGEPIKIQPLSGEESIVCNPNGAVQIYHDNDMKMQTQSDGMRIEDAGYLYFANDAEDSSSSIRNVESSTNANLSFSTVASGSGSIRWTISHEGKFIPNGNNTYDIGTTSNRVRNIYTNDLNLSNKGSQNDVDGTWGNYTIQEGESDLFLINNRSGKKYKFNLTEVS